MESPAVQLENLNQTSDDQNNENTVQIVTLQNTLGNNTKTYTSVSNIEIIEVHTELQEGEDTEDLVILRKDPATRKNLINKPAYAKLHRTLSPGRNSNSIDSIKGKYEVNVKPDLIDVNNANKDSETEQTAKNRTSPKLDEETVQSLKNKYSPASFGYPKAANRNSRLPLPKPRSSVKSQIILPQTKPEKNKLRYSLDVDKKPKSKDENSNELYRKNSSSSGEFISIITRSDSEASVDKFEKELNLFTMEGKPKEKKRSNSFRKIFSGKIFGKDKKKKEEDKNKVEFKEIVAYTDNLQNEHAFSRQSAHRHTTGGNSNANKPKQTKITRTGSDRSARPQQLIITKEMEDRYAQMHVNQFNHIIHTFESPTSEAPPTQGYVRMDKPIVKNNPGPTNYMNLPNVKKYIDTSSSASTLESERSNVYQNNPFTNREQVLPEGGTKNDLNTTRSIRFGENNDNTRDTPPRAQELRQDVRLVNPKALIPINSERPLPNPYHGSANSTLEKPKISPKPTLTNNSLHQTRPHFDETYGTVFDSVENPQGRTRVQRPLSNEARELQKPPKSPSFEATKLKLPPNREIIPLSPRMKSPIPHDNVSTEKIIATELLKPTKSPTAIRRGNGKLSSPSHQRLDDIDYPYNLNNERNEKSLERNASVAAKPPVSRIPSRRSPEASSSSANSLTRQRLSQQSPAFDSKRLSQASPASENMENIYGRYRRSQASPVVENQERIVTNAMIHVNSPTTRTPTPNQLLHNRSLSPIRPQSARSSTPVDLRMSPSSKSSPQKEDMRKSVEAYYWKELRKLKDQENMDVYLYEMSMTPYGYAEEPISVRRSRSLSPTTQRNSRRSLSLPRDPRPNNIVRDMPDNPYGRMQPAPIPEDRVVINPQRNVVYGQLQQYPPNFRRNAPERRTIDGAPRSYENYNNNNNNTNSLYRPIFKRGSLTTPIRELEDPQNKKVSFSSSRAASQQPQNSWPTKNGFTQSPPQRRVENNRNSSAEDDVFLPNTQRGVNIYDGNEIYGYTNKPPNLRQEYAPSNESIYYSRQNPELQNKEPLYDPNVRYRQEYVQEESLYGQPLDAVRTPYGLTRHGSIQMQEPVFVQRQVATRRLSYDNVPVNISVQRRIPEPQYVNRQLPPQNQVDPRFGFKREVILKDEIFGQFGGYITNDERYLLNRQPQNPIYSSRQSVAEPIYGRNGGGPRQVSMRNKVCDIYGQIHDRDTPSATPNQIRKSGVILGQLQPSSPQLVRQSHISNEQFARNSRLTASANDMYRRQNNADPRYRSDVVYNGARYPQQEFGAPTRPLPPVPMDRKLLLRNTSGKSDTESASDANEMQRVMNSSAKNKKRSFFGK